MYRSLVLSWRHCIRATTQVSCDLAVTTHLYLRSKVKMPNLHFDPYDEGLSDEDELDGREYRRRIHPLKEFGRRKFRKRFRLTKRVTEYLIDDYYRFVPSTGLNQGGAVSIEDKFCLGLRYLATGSNFSLVADYQGVHISTVSRAVRDVSNYFYDQSYRYIRWPETPQEKLNSCATFLHDHGYPRVLGCVDGTHIGIRRPWINEAAFINRKGFYSLNTMVVCDSDRFITHVNPKYAGSVQDAYIWNVSAMRRQSDLYMLDPFFLLGDSGYGCGPNLFTPVLVPRTQEEHAYNQWHRKTRCIVENTIGQMKQRWRCLDASGGYLFHQPNRACKIIIACACLHNIANYYGIPNENDNDRDAFRQRREDNGQPDTDDEDDDEYTKREQYIDMFF